MTSSHNFSALVEAARVHSPTLALVLGSGLGAVSRRIRNLQKIPFEEIPGLPSALIPGHGGYLTLGNWAGKQILVFEGRIHFYEGHTWNEVAVPVLTAKSLGARFLVATNAAGGIHPSLEPGSLMIVRDHIEWTRPYCWRQAGPGGMGPERISPYSVNLNN